jgi:diguanylate cyclase (GGDEF)-like protein
MPRYTSLMRLHGFFRTQLAWATFCILALFACSTNAASVVQIEDSTPGLPLAGVISYFEDVEGQLTLTDIRSRVGDFKPTSAKNGINFGYTASTYWFYFRAIAPGRGDERRVLEIAYPPLDSIDVHVLNGNAEKHLHSGDQIPFSARPVAHGNFVFPLTFSAGQDSDVFIRITSSGTLTVPATLWMSDDFARHSELNYALLSIYFGWLFALGLYNLMLFFSTRDRVFLAYVAFVLSFALASLAYTGLAAQFLWPEFPRWADVALIVGLVLTVLLGANFTRQFLHTMSGPQWIDWPLRIICWGSATVLILLALMPQRLPTLIIAAFGFAFVLAGPVAAIYAIRSRQPGAKYFLAAWSFFFIGTMVFNLRNTGLIPTNTFTIYAIQIGSAMEMLLLSFALADRMNVLRKEKEQAQQALLATEKSLVEVLRRSEIELEQRVAQRTKDLEAANHRLQVSEELLRNIAHHDALTGLANRLMLQLNLDQAVKRARRTEQSFALLMIDLDGFKPVNDQHGHEAGDLLLKEIGSRLVAAVRESDLVARLGGDEFVCVLESVSDAKTASAVSEKLIHEIRQPVPLASGTCVSVGASIGIAMFSKEVNGADPLLKAADTAMYAAKAAGKNCCVIA